MENCFLPAMVLPDIEMYGGDTQPWEISIIHENGVLYTVTEATGYSSEMTITPFSVSAYNASVSPVLTKSGRISVGSDDNAIFMFEFDKSDTIHLRGKYIYQIAFSNEDTKLRVGQGKLIIKPNNNAGGL